MTFLDQVFLVALGFGIVLTVLASLWLVSALMGRVFIAREAALARAASAAAAPQAPAPQPVVAPGVPAAHVAAITAAVAVLTGGRGRVASVSLPPHQAGAWAQSGRLEQYSSHHLHYNWTIPGPPHTEQAAPVHHEPPPPPTRSSK